MYKDRDRIFSPDLGFSTSFFHIQESIEIAFDERKFWQTMDIFVSMLPPKKAAQLYEDPVIGRVLTDRSAKNTAEIVMALAASFQIAFTRFDD